MAVIEILSPGNRDSRAALRNFVEKTIGFLRAGIHVLIVDLFPPTPRDPFGIHKAVWDEIIGIGVHRRRGPDAVQVTDAGLALLAGLTEGELLCKGDKPGT